MKFLVCWNETVENNCSVVIEATSKKEAIRKWREGLYEDYERDESSNSFDEPNINDVEKIEED